MIQIHINKACAHLCSPPELLTAGMAKAVSVRFAFSEDWDGLTKTAVFSNGRATVDVLAAKWDGDTVNVPPEILAVPGRYVRVGVYGTNASGVVLPTVWVTLGKVQPAAEPSGDPSTDPTLPVWAQLREIIGDLNNLTTAAKENLVAAINEAAKTGSGGAGSIDLRTADGYIQYSNDGGETWENLIALADLKGEKGDTGAPGPQGETGPAGPQGETGPAGPQGKTGPAGQDGAPGKDGSPGKDGADGAPGQDGFSPSASVAETATGATITITDKTGTTTAEIKNGKDGAPGKDGTNGAPGTPGANGTDGKDGTTFTPSVSAAGDLSWTNDGGKANPAPVNIKGPQGETGPQGPTGATGPQGAPGADYTLTDADKTKIAAEVIAGGIEAQLGPVPLQAPSAAAVGQIVKIKAVDAAGKITETEAVDLPSGGGSGDTWELITSGEMAEAASLLITTDADGAALALKSAQIIVEGATSFARATMLRFEVDNRVDNRNSQKFAVELPGDGKNDNPNICAVYIAEHNKIPILYAEIPMSDTSWASNALKVQAAKKSTEVDNVSTHSFDPLTVTINRIYIGNSMGTGKLGAGCKYQIWGIRA